MKEPYGVSSPGVTDDFGPAYSELTAGYPEDAALPATRSLLARSATMSPAVDLWVVSESQYVLPFVPVLIPGFQFQFH